MMDACKQSQGGSEKVGRTHAKKQAFSSHERHGLQKQVDGVGAVMEIEQVHGLGFFTV